MTGTQEMDLCDYVLATSWKRAFGGKASEEVHDVLQVRSDLLIRILVYMESKPNTPITPALIRGWIDEMTAASQRAPAP